MNADGVGVNQPHYKACSLNECTYQKPISLWFIFENINTPNCNLRIFVVNEHRSIELGPLIGLNGNHPHGTREIDLSFPSIYRFLAKSIYKNWKFFRNQKIKSL